MPLSKPKPPTPKTPKQKHNGPKRYQPFDSTGKPVSIPKTPKKPAGSGSKSSNRNK